ncbi:hypothetical protein HJB88_29550 [Rhizobium sp. NZLR5]|uniref:hypothetical protein n=1 Tax=unclassified Rhizobium TaxID=2613769 RepID=UPI001C832596|nr:MULTISPECIES: hypothetical protein [unclassified Rhizobium]MBX5160335.1 hypothetical protein [Rhizobium sp. NZLR8]MBX5186728.1 hypothetical protein [Rhizobium sp. NZLR5]
METNFSITITEKSRTIDSELSGQKHYGPNNELRELLERLAREAELAGIAVSKDIHQTDLARGRHHYRPTIDIVTWVAATYVWVAHAPAVADFVKTLLEIVEKIISIRKDLANPDEIGGSMQTPTIEVLIDGKVLNLTDEKKLLDKLRKIAKKQLALEDQSERLVNAKQPKPKKKKSKTIDV